MLSGIYNFATPPTPTSSIALKIGTNYVPGAAGTSEAGILLDSSNDGYGAFLQGNYTGDMVGPDGRYRFEFSSLANGNSTQYGEWTYQGLSINGNLALNGTGNLAVAGTAAATAFTGSGSGLTAVPESGDVTGTSSATVVNQIGGVNASTFFREFSTPMPGTNMGGSGPVGAAGSSAFGNVLLVRDGNGGNNASSGTGAGGAGASLFSYAITYLGGSGGNANGNFSGGNGGDTIQPFVVHGGHGGDASSTANGGKGGTAGGIVLNGGNGGAGASVAGGMGGSGGIINAYGGSGIAGFPGGAAGTISMYGGSANIAGAGGAAGTLSMFGGSPATSGVGAAGGSINVAASATTPGGSLILNAGTNTITTSGSTQYTLTMPATQNDTFAMLGATQAFTGVNTFTRVKAVGTLTPAGTTGPRTINQMSGSVRIAAGGNSVLVTDSYVTTASSVFATVSTNDATAYLKNIVPNAGSFTITLGANATAETEIRFFVVN